MLAFKTQLNINNELLFLKIPSSFKGKRVEIIVLETYDLEETNSIRDTSDEVETFYDSFLVPEEITSTSCSQIPNEFQKFLLMSPTWTENEYQSFVETRKLFNQWKIE
jgi:hypothetical protein